MAEEVAQHRPIVTRTTVAVDAKSETKTFETGKTIAYKASEAVYVDGEIYKPDEVFVTNKPKGETWRPVNPVERAAADAGKPTKDDVDLEKLDVSALKALAATKGLNLGDATSKKDIITVIKAADTPAL